MEGVRLVDAHAGDVPVRELEGSGVGVDVGVAVRRAAGAGVGVASPVTASTAIMISTRACEDSDGVLTERQVDDDIV